MVIIINNNRYYKKYYHPFLCELSRVHQSLFTVFTVLHQLYGIGDPSPQFTNNKYKEIRGLHYVFVRGFKGVYWLYQSVNFRVKTWIVQNSDSNRNCIKVQLSISVKDYKKIVVIRITIFYYYYFIIRFILLIFFIMMS